MNQRVNIREFNRLANIIMKDISDLPIEQLKEFNSRIRQSCFSTTSNMHRLGTCIRMVWWQ